MLYAIPRMYSVLLGRVGTLKAASVFPWFSLDPKPGTINENLFPTCLL